MYSWKIFLNSYFSIENINFSLHINIFLNHFSDRQLLIKRRNSNFLHNHAYHQTSFYTMYHITHNQGPEFSWLTDQIIFKVLSNFSVNFLHEKLNFGLIHNIKNALHNKMLLSCYKNHVYHFFYSLIS